mmetsp:Transcript_1649/g.4553  ORF Transcript_1649/g.4553 Transcript_1649/m.4553 type:complete len:88 (+) Transcript_1649:406-669(+)
MTRGDAGTIVGLGANLVVVRYGNNKLSLVANHIAKSNAVASNVSARAFGEWYMPLPSCILRLGHCGKHSNIEISFILWGRWRNVTLV